MLWRASAFMAFRHHSITSALYPIRDGASPGDRLIIGRADFSSDIFCYSQTKCLCPEWASSFSVFAYSAMNAYALESIGVYGYSPSCNHFCPLPNKRRCQFWRPSHYWKDRLFLPTSSVTHRQNAYAPSGHPLSAFSLIQRGMLMPLTGIGCLCQRHLFIEHFTFPDPCRDHPADGISMGKVIIILTLRQGDFS